MNKILSVENVSKIYGQLKALENVSLDINSGDWLAIMGPSGSGKTTLMNVIGCLDSPTEGRVVLDGLSLDRLGSNELTAIRRESIGLIFQQFHLVGHLTALENVMVAQYYHSLVDAKEALEALAKVGLSDRSKHLPRQLSGGEQQRVCIARALINHPKILLADEPTGNLDEANEAIVMGILSDLHQHGGTIIVVTHSPEVAAHAQRTVVLEHGRVAKDSLPVKINQLASN
ncbi:MAG: ABC transporter ATP-binding protein [Deltaproteobacteria bacterium]|jgi:putative ABC transport system ATP-binding protein|nr:ABC transporter ATP-binding protein [Deltaproteobacteria bacterium]